MSPRISSASKIPFSDIFLARFVASPKSDVKVRLTKEGETIKKDMEGLEKKMHYLETTYKNSKDHLDAVFKNGGR